MFRETRHEDRLSKRESSARWKSERILCKMDRRGNVGKEERQRFQGLGPLRLGFMVWSFACVSNDIKKGLYAEIETGTHLRGNVGEEGFDCNP